MSFLAPLFLLGALAVALPIIFHLIRRTPRDRLPFSSLMFLQPSPPRVSRRSRLENLLLLILRGFVLCLLAFAFARPFLQKQFAEAADPGQGRRIVMLLDTSASMQREGLWPAARARFEAALRETSPLDAVAVFTFARQAQPLISFEQWSALPPGERVAATLARLEGVAPGWQSTHLGNAILSGVESLEDIGARQEAGTEPAPRRIVVITDLQEGSRLDGLQGYEWPPGIEVRVETVPPKRPTNAGLHLLAESAEDEPPVGEVLLRVRVSNSADAAREQFQLRWMREDGGVPAGPAIDAYVPPGQSRIVKVPPIPAGLGAARLVLSGDDEPFDNTLHYVAVKPQRARVLFLGNDNERDPAQLLFYLKRAFQDTRRLAVEVVARPLNQPLLETDLLGAHFLVIGDLLPQAHAAGVRRFIENGRHALLVLRSAADADTLARVAGFGSVICTEASPRGYALLGPIEFAHPLFAPFDDPRFSDFTRIHFWKHRRLETGNLKSARVLARFDSGDPALVELPLGKGALLTLTAGWHPADSQLALSSKFVPLLYSMLELSGDLRPARPQYLVGEPLAWIAPAGAATASVLVRKPDGTEAPLDADGRFTGTDQPGLYTVLSAEAPARFPVNLDPAESRTAPLVLEELERLGLPLRVETAAAAQLAAERKRQLQNTELENRQKLWRWLLVAALVVLVVETWLAGRLSRRAAAQPEATA